MHHDQLHRPFLQRCAEEFHRLDDRAVYTAHRDEFYMQHFTSGVKADGPDMFPVTVRIGRREQNGLKQREDIGGGADVAASCFDSGDGLIDLHGVGCLMVRESMID